MRTNTRLSTQRRRHTGGLCYACHMLVPVIFLFSTAIAGAQIVSNSTLADQTLASRWGTLVEPLLADSFTWLLVFLIVIFWINMFCVRALLVRIPADHRSRSFWIAAGVFTGVLAWGLNRLLAGRRPSGAPAEAAAEEGDRGSAATPVKSMSLLTRDGQHIESRLGRKVASGLTDTLRLLDEATEKKASDVHIDAVEHGVRFALRIDGKLRPAEMFSEKAGRRVMSVLKTAAGIDYATRQESRDGACTFLCGDHKYDLRVAQAWAVNGETIVVRILETHSEEQSLEALGVPPSFAPELRSLMAEQTGLIVVAGPTGSGKTTTLYSLLRSVSGEGRAILTIEDPVEYRIPAATQISLNPRVGSSFASALKTSMRHDCDIILVGEVRDKETLEVAFQAALTGHLVLTTLHASSITAVVGRLQQLGLNSFMMGAGLRAVICQRLVRKLCGECRQPYVPEPEERRKWGLGADVGPDTVFFSPGGCEFCEQTGFRGRTAVVHYVLLDRAVRDRLTQGENEGTVLPDILRRARGQVSDYVEQLLLQGVTSTEEISSTLPMFGVADG